MKELFTLWIQSGLDEFTKLCIKSWLRLDYHVKLYCYEEPIGLDLIEFPNVEWLDASDIVPMPPIDNYASIADYFRFYYLKNYGGTWIDSDELLLRHLPESEIIISSEASKLIGAYKTKDRIFSPNIGVLRFPKNHIIMEKTLERVEKAINRGIKNNSNYNSLMKIFQKIIIKDYLHLVSDYNEYCPINWSYAKELYTQSDIISTNKHGIVQNNMEWILINSIGIHLWRNIYKNKNLTPLKNCVFLKLKRMIID